MATYNLNTKIVMRHDTPQAWNDNNPILLCGEIGCAIDSKTGISTIKVGDGIHHWRDLETRLGEKEPTISTMQMSINEAQEALQKIAKAASTAGVSMTEAVAALGNIYTVPGNEKPVKVAFEGVPCSTQRALVKLTQGMKEFKEQEEKKNPYLEDFEIPHYDFEDINIKDLIDF